MKQQWRIQKASVGDRSFKQFLSSSILDFWKNSIFSGQKIDYKAQNTS